MTDNRFYWFLVGWTAAIAAACWISLMLEGR
jgi:hypothetical protein